MTTKKNVKLLFFGCNKFIYPLCTDKVLKMNEKVVSFKVTEEENDFTKHKALLRDQNYSMNCVFFFRSSVIILDL